MALSSDNKRNVPTLIVAILIALIALAILFMLRTTEPTENASSPPLQPNAVFQFAEGAGPLQAGDSAWDFRLTDISGNTLHLNDLAGRPIVINFWASWCGPCRIEFPHLQAAHEAYGDEVVFLAINQQEDLETVTDYFDELGLTLTALLDADATVAQQYAVGRTLPTTVFVDAKGHISAIHRGPMTLGQIEGYLAVATTQ